MTRAEKARRIREILDRCVPLPSAPLRHRDPFTLLVAVVLSAQCTDARVNEVAPRLFDLADTPAAMAALSVARVRQVIRPCGLAPAKAKAIVELSRRITREHGGRVPQSFEALEALPGVGHKTASVVMNQAFGVPAFAVDTHIHRCAERWGLSNGQSVARTERDLKRLYPEDAWGRLHLQIILFARAHCPARNHDPDACPICSWAARKRRRPPARKPGQRAARR